MINKPENGEIVSRDILDLLPHRYPFLLVDRVLSFEPMKSVHAIKSVSINEPFFQGHFPSYPVMPGVLILEALAQAGVLIHDSACGHRRQDLSFHRHGESPLSAPRVSR